MAVIGAVADSTSAISSVQNELKLLNFVEDAFDKFLVGRGIMIPGGHVRREIPLDGEFEARGGGELHAELHAYQRSWSRQKAILRHPLPAFSQIFSWVCHKL